MKITELADPDEWTEPEEEAKKFRDFYSGHSIGVCIDALADARAEAKDAQWHFKNAALHMDAIVDSRDTPARFTDEACKIHAQCTAAVEWYDDFTEALSEQLEDVRATRID